LEMVLVELKKEQNSGEAWRDQTTMELETVDVRVKHGAQTGRSSRDHDESPESPREDGDVWRRAFSGYDDEDDDEPGEELDSWDAKMAWGCSRAAEDVDVDAAAAGASAGGGWGSEEGLSTGRLPGLPKWSRRV